MIPDGILHELTQSVNFPGFFITDLRFQDGALALTLQRRYHSARCSQCGRYQGKFYDSQWRTIRDLNWAGTEVLIHIKRVRVDCHSCGIKVENLPFAEPYAKTTRRFARCLGELCRYMTRSDVAFIYGLSEDTIGNYEWMVLSELKKERKKEFSELRQLRFDEIAIRKGHNYVTVFANHETGSVLGVVEGRKVDDLQPFFGSLGPKVCEQIEAVCIDMSKSYIAAVKRWCCNAKLVFDRFHVVKHMNDALNKVRLREKRKLDKEEQKKWRHSKYALGKNPENLTENQREALAYLLENFPMIAAVYKYKEALRQLWEKPTKKGAKIALTRWLNQAERLEQPALTEFCELIKRHRDEVLNYYDFPLTNGPQEGLNNKIGVVRRRAYGYRNIDWYSLKIFQTTAPKQSPFWA